LVFVDLEPAHLLARLAEGKVYLGETAVQARAQFFQLETLTALRELAIKRVMHHVDSQLKTEQQARSRSHSYLIADKLLVLISNRRDHEYLIRAGRRVAEKRQMPWLVVWVDTGALQYQSQQLRLQAAFALARELGAETAVLHGPNTMQTIQPYILEQRVNTVLVGAGCKRRWQPWRQPLYQQLIKSGLPLEVTVVPPPQNEVALPEPAGPAVQGLGLISGYGFGVIAVALCSVLAVLLQQVLPNSNLVLVYVMAVVTCGLRYGARPALFTSILAFLSFNYFLTEPYFSLNVNKPHDMATLLFLAVIGAVCGPAASRIRQQFLLLRAANRYSEFQREFAAELTLVHQPPQLWQVLRQQVLKALAGMQTSNSWAGQVLLACPQQQQWQWQGEPVRALLPLDLAVLEWSARHQQSAGRFSQTLSASSWSATPLIVAGDTVAVLLVQYPPQLVAPSPADLQLLQSLLQQAGSVWQRLQLTTELESSRVKAEMEQLRSALLSSVSHDLRSPLSAMMGSAESLIMLQQQLTAADRNELLQTILSESQRLDRYIQNLLDMTRLGHGGLKLERDWVELTDILASARVRLKKYFPAQELQILLQDQIPALYVHAALLEQAIFNILENAARYSPPHCAVQIRVSLSPGQVSATTGPQASRCRIEIEDQGPGIPPDQREKVFDMFYVVADGDSKRHNTGMGLAICRGMIGAHGGTVRAEAARQGQGSCFVIELPLAQTAANRSALSQPEPEPEKPREITRA
jgi:two-component system sensor histidine kinase KdpD